MKKIKLSYDEQLCPRCGSKQKISKRWKEKVITFSGSIMVDCSQIICTNKKCQEAFDKALAEDNKKRLADRVKKEANDKERKANALLHAAQTKRKKAK